MPKQIYSLKQFLDENPRYLRAPNLRTNHGNYGSEKWWNAIDTRKIRKTVKTGQIVSLHREGMDASMPNTALVQTQNGDFWKLFLDVNRRRYFKKYRVEARVKAIYATLYLKPNKIPFLAKPHIDEVLEIWILD